MTSSTLLAASRPRVEGHPPYVASHGDLAIELARRAGLILDPWQQDSLRLMMSVREDGKWACRHYCEWVPRQNGKGALLEARVLAGFLLLGEQRITWTAHEFKTANDGFERLKELIMALGKQVRPNDDRLWDIAIAPGKSIRIRVSEGNDNKGFRRLDTKAKIRFIARSKGSGRGLQGDLIVLDEAFALTAVHQNALQPTLRARPNAQVVYTSTPPLDGNSGELMFSFRARAEAGDFIRLGYRDWGLAGDLDHLERINLDDRRLWAASNPAYGIRITDEDVEDDRRTMTAQGGRGFALECLGVWPLPVGVAGGSIAKDDFEAICDPDAKRDVSAGCALGVDLSVDRSYAAIFLYGRSVDGKGFARLIDYMPGTDRVVPRLEALVAKLDPVAVGMGKNTYAFLKNALTAAGITKPVDPKKPRKGDVAVIEAADMSAACARVINDTRQHTVWVKPDEEKPEFLEDAVAGAKTRRMGDTIAWAHKAEDDETSPVGAWTVAQAGYDERVNAVRAYAPATAPAAPPTGDVRELFRPIERLNI